MLPLLFSCEMADPNDDDAVLSTLRTIISNGDLETLTLKMVIRQMVPAFGLGIKERKKWISGQIGAIVNSAAEDAGAAELPSASAPAAAAAAPAAADPPPDPTPELTCEEVARLMQAEEDRGGRARRACTAPPKRRRLPKAKKRKHPLTSAAAEEPDGSLAFESSETSEDEEPPPPRAKKARAGPRPVCVMQPLLSFLRDTKLMGPGEEMAQRHVVQQHILSVMKQRGLKNPADGREFLLDEELTRIFKRKKLTYFTIAKHLVPLLKQLEGSSWDGPQQHHASASAKGKTKAIKAAKTTKTAAAKTKAKGMPKKQAKAAAAAAKPKSGGGSSGYMAPLKLSAPLASVCTHTIFTHAERRN